MKTASPAECRAGYAVLASLVVIAAVLLVQQRKLNPALAPIPQEFTTGTTLALPVPEGMEVMGAVEQFGDETLSDKIDGRAELYLSAGFSELRTQRLMVSSQPEQWLELFVYTMNSHEAAFAVFSGQRRPGATPLDVGDEGYLTDNAAFAMQGNMYVEAIAAQSRMEAALEASVTAVLGARTSKSGKVLLEKDMLPAAGQKEGTLTLLATDAFGCDLLDRIFVASYADADGEGVLFLSRRADTAEAAKLAEGYSSFLSENGGEQREGGVVELFGRFEAARAEGGWLFGVHDATTEAWARQALAILQERVAVQGGGTDESP